ncbi:hypothetical protein SETIT_1G123200v2 [Setaria italica]|uniref:Uncharacterized protein n=1 Tax=Setaria italica TaxID=4555 RepID=A0A368PJH0_SETIT|nr:hypothetical protein SETIT_1G123200v2 [Setaria italica]
MAVHVKYDWIFDNPWCRFVCYCKEEAEKCEACKWVDLEWDVRNKGILVKLMKRKVKAEEDASIWQEGCGYAMRELDETAGELKKVKRYHGETTLQLMNTKLKAKRDARM